MRDHLAQLLPREIARARTDRLGERQQRIRPRIERDAPTLAATDGTVHHQDRIAEGHHEGTSEEKMISMSPIQEPHVRKSRTTEDIETSKWIKRRFSISIAQT
jgi:hypothetical protein